MSDTVTVWLSKKTQDELETLIKAYGENRSRVINRLISQAYQNEEVKQLIKDQLNQWQAEAAEIAKQNELEGRN